MKIGEPASPVTCSAAEAPAPGTCVPDHEGQVNRRLLAAMAWLDGAAGELGGTDRDVLLVGEVAPQRAKYAFMSRERAVELVARTQPSLLEAMLGVPPGYRTALVLIDDMIAVFPVPAPAPRRAA